jgi:hypothetical protein
LKCTAKAICISNGAHMPSEKTLDVIAFKAFYSADSNNDDVLEFDE